MRYWWVPNGVNISRTEFSSRGYLLNPSSGTGWQKIGKTTIPCHYYWPHLRDTPLSRQGKNILVLGDSFTFGWMLPWEKTYISQLQVHSDYQFGKNQYHFLNAAVGGWGGADFLAYLEEYGAKIAPQYVLIFLNTDDIGRAIKRNLYVLPPDSTQLTQNFHPLSMTALRKMLFNNWLYEHSVLLQFIRNNLSLAHLRQEKSIKENQANIYTIPISSDMDFQDEYAVRYGEALFLAINDWCKKHDAKLLIVTTGFNAFYPDKVRDPTKTFISQARHFFAKHNIDFYDMAPDFKKSVAGQRFQIPIDKHPNELGARVIAYLSWQWLKEKI